MTTSKSLSEKVMDEITKTGYPLEIIAARELQFRQWPVIHNPAYLDNIENISREYDIRAFHRWEVPSESTKFSLSVYLIVECKKSDKPWVFFTTPEKFNQSNLGQLVKGRSKDKRILTSKGSSKSYISDERLTSFHHYFASDTLARTYYEPFKGKEKHGYSPMIFDAVMSVVNATLFMISDHPLGGTFRIFYPIIVFDGDLFEARVNSSDAIDLIKSDYQRLEFNYMLPARSSRDPSWELQERFIIDVLRLEHLSAFLDLIESGHESMAQILGEEFDQRVNSA